MLDTYSLPPLALDWSGQAIDFVPNFGMPLDMTWKNTKAFRLEDLSVQHSESTERCWHTILRMAKSKKSKAKANAEGSDAAGETAPCTLESLLENVELRYKICALIHDLRNVDKDHNAQVRLASTTDERYMSAPYFSPSEATRVKSATTSDGKTTEEEMTSQFESFFNKRSASGDFRPRGPHDMVPIFLEVFGLDLSDIKDEKFLGRLRRSGLPPV